MNPSDTIAAISTAPGQSGIGIVRLSGPDSLRIAQEIFLASHGGRLKPASHTLQYGRIIDPQTGRHIDEVLLCWMRAPKTYTREDIVEINGHGGSIPLRNILRLCLRHGARMARPGEFTLRAYLNGRIDLTQAEAVSDLINAQTDTALKLAAEQLEGGLSAKVTAIRDDLLRLVSEVEAGIDFPDEELVIIPHSQIASAIRKIQKQLEPLIRSFSQGRILREGIKCAIIGRPNVGKSSLLNRLLGSDRAIVTPIPGTTRDTIEEALNIGGYPVRLLDTAGITQSRDIVESHGIERSRKAMDSAQLILLVLDGSQPLQLDDRQILTDCKLRLNQLILIINKSDLPVKLELDQLTGIQPVYISAKTGQDIEHLFTQIKTHLDGDHATGPEEIIVTNARHHQALSEANSSLAAALTSAQSNLSLELIALDLRSTLDYLGDIIGMITSEDVLN